MIVDIIAVERGELIVTVDEEGETRVHDVYTISAPVTGRVRRISLHAGDAVESVATTVAEIEPIDPAFLDPRGEAQARADVRAAESAETVRKETMPPWYYPWARLSAAERQALAHGLEATFGRKR